MTWWRCSADYGEHDADCESQNDICAQCGHKRSSHDGNGECHCFMGEMFGDCPCDGFME